MLWRFFSSVYFEWRQIVRTHKIRCFFFGFSTFFFDSSQKKIRENLTQHTDIYIYTFERKKTPTLHTIKNNQHLFFILLFSVFFSFIKKPIVMKKKSLCFSSLISTLFSFVLSLHLSSFFLVMVSSWTWVYLFGSMCVSVPLLLDRNHHQPGVWSVSSN